MTKKERRVKYRGASTICPFYKSETATTVVCEGAVAGCDSVFKFRASAEKDRYKERCCDCFEYAVRCNLAALLMRQYAD